MAGHVVYLCVLIRSNIIITTNGFWLNQRENICQIWWRKCNKLYPWGCFSILLVIQIIQYHVAWPSTKYQFTGIIVRYLELIYQVSDSAQTSVLYHMFVSYNSLKKILELIFRLKTFQVRFKALGIWSGIHWNAVKLKLGKTNPKQ